MSEEYWSGVVFCTLVALVVIVWRVCVCIETYAKWKYGEYDDDKEG
jgi:hypothetical protein